MESPAVSCHQRLTALDTLVPPAYIRFLVLFNAPDVTSALAHLEAGIQRLVSECPFLAGYVFTGPIPGDPNSGCHIIPPRESDADLIITTVKRVSESYRKVYPEHQAHAGLDVTHFPLKPIADIVNPSPIFRLQINLFNDGVGLGFALHHNVMDAIGAGTVVKALGSCCCRTDSGTELGLDLNTLTPLQYSARASLNKLTPVARDSELDRSRYGLQPHPGSIMFDQSGFGLLPPASRFRLSATKIQDLKTHLNNVIARSESLQKQFGPTSWISNNDTLVALIWLCYNRAKRRSEPPSSTQPFAINPGICMPANIRPRVHPPLPSTFLGNAAVPVKPAMDAQPLLSAIGNGSLLTDEVVPERIRDDALCQVALAVRQAVSRVNNDYARDITSLMQNPQVPLIYEYNHDTNISSWRDSAMYEAYFGEELGFPLDVCLDVPAMGYFTLAPKRRAPDDSWEVLAVLSPAIAGCLRDDDIWSSVLSDSPPAGE
ncbi:hypothetical protein P168DRAFT_280131 [Aspergillus campestris IBT 28561]|uniref:Trichothecene 3-O-acetyltransferase-like N-terminal domain-containing protein n=1 Tax=Aspergillus campestris (strain IBT 28561) TaxID=1392248 RepID=A0A2I1DA57_ASPC2|nr:uncharacterized protein P168DRAFT_280131 [Aspergillus campestris IBT 28561]PKY06749.1 hypothetical protein P168DRAFT_280131 [Aspergillus campestris IBT 28561]